MMLQKRTKGIATDILMLKLERKQEVQNKKKRILHIKQQICLGTKRITAMVIISNLPVKEPNYKSPFSVLYCKFDEK